MSQATIQSLIEQVRNETQLHGNTKERIASLLTLLNTEKLDRPAVESIISEITNISPLFFDQFGNILSSLSAGWTEQTAYEADGPRLVKKITGYTGATGTIPEMLSVNIGKYYKADGTLTTVKAEGANFRGDVGQAITINNNYNLDPEQIVPSEALYNDATETLAGDVLKRVDINTVENVNYRETTTWHDGSAMDDTKADGVIYIKKGEKYYKRQIEDFVNILWFGVTNDGVDYPDDGAPYGNRNHYLIKDAFGLCIKMGLNLFFPQGKYTTGNYSFPFSSPLGGLELKDCNNILIFGEGRNTILSSDSQTGADVIQLNSLKNIHFKDFSITSTVAKTDYLNEAISGSNGVSITNGFDNISIENVHVYDLGEVEYPTYIDGGKGFTLQNDKDIILPQGRLKISNCSTLNCSYGWRNDGFLSDVMKNNIDIEIDLKIERSWVGFSISYDGATEAFDENKRVNYNANITLIDCQQDVFISRQFGGKFNFYVQSDMPFDEVKKNPRSGNLWKNSVISGNSFDELVYNAFLGYIKFADVKIYGYKKQVDFKYYLGTVGSTPESFTIGRSESNNFIFQVSGNVIDKEIKITTYGGHSNYRNTFNFENLIEDVPIEILYEANQNLVIANKRILSNINSEVINFGEYATISRNGFGGVKVKQTIGSSAGLSVLEILSNTDERVYKVLNNGDIVLKNESKIISGSSNPNGNVNAEKGSIYFRTDSAWLYLKTTSISLDTGWVNIYGTTSGSSAERPTLNAGNIGFSFFDNTLKRPIFWEGTKWVKADGTDA